MRRSALAVLAFAPALACGNLLGLSEPEQAADVDTGTSDAADVVPADASSEAQASPCASGTHLLCDDFEHGGDPRWEKPASGVAIEPREGGGNVLVATLPAGNEARAYLTFPTGSTRPLRATFALRVVDPRWSTGASGASNFAVAAFMVPNGADSLTFNAYVGPRTGGANMQLTWQKPAFDASKNQPLSLDEWHRVVLEADFGATARGRLEVDGVVLGEASGFSTSEAPPSFIVGLYRPNADTPALRVEIDDVVLDEL